MALCMEMWKMTVPEGYTYKADLLKFAQTKHNIYTDLIKRISPVWQLLKHKLGSCLKV